MGRVVLKCGASSPGRIVLGASCLTFKLDDKFCSGLPLKRLHVNLKAIAHERNTISDQVLRQDYNSFWFKF